MKANCKSIFLINILFLSFYQVGCSTLKTSQVINSSDDALIKTRHHHLNLQNCMPPFNNYKFFEDAKSFPFEDRTRDLSLINAWWLSEISILSYSEKSFVEKKLKQNGFRLVNQRA